MRIRGIIVEYDLPEAAVILGISPRGAIATNVATPSAQGTS